MYNKISSAVEDIQILRVKAYYGSHCELIDVIKLSDDIEPVAIIQNGPHMFLSYVHSRRADKLQIYAHYPLLEILDLTEYQLLYILLQFGVQMDKWLVNDNADDTQNTSDNESYVLNHIASKEEALVV